MNHLVYWGELVIWVLWMLIYGLFFQIPHLGLGSELGYVAYHILNTPKFYFTCILVVIVALFRDFMWKSAKRTFFPQPYHIVQERALVELLTPTISNSTSNQPAYKHLGFAFEEPHDRVIVQSPNLVKKEKAQ